MAAKTEPASLGDALKWEESNDYSRKTVIVASGNNLALCQVVGKILRATPTTGTAGTNTGNGTCGSVAAGQKTKVGTYTLTCITADTNSGTFAVKDPDGNSLPDATVAVAYANPQINFTIADGTTDFSVDDSFTIPVAAGSGKYAALNQDAVDGTEDAAGFVIAAVDATSSDKYGVIIERDAMVAMDNLVWPADIDAGEKTAAIAQLDAIGIKAVSLA